jgi:hypothetical protein
VGIKQKCHWKKYISAGYLLKAVTEVLQQQQQQFGAVVSVAAALTVLEGYRLHCAELPASTERRVVRVLSHASSKLRQCEAELSSSSDDATVLEQWTQDTQRIAQDSADKLREVSLVNDCHQSPL